LEDLLGLLGAEARCGPCGSERISSGFGRIVAWVVGVSLPDGGGRSSPVGTVILAVLVVIVPSRGCTAYTGCTGWLDSAVTGKDVAPGSPDSEGVGKRRLPGCLRRLVRRVGRGVK